jgi:hypothetical protein
MEHRSILIQRRCRALSAGDFADLRNLPSDHRPYGDDDVIKRVYRLDDAPVNRLTHFLHADFLVQSHLQRRARENGESNGLRRRACTWRVRCRHRFAR